MNDGSKGGVKRIEYIQVYPPSNISFVFIFYLYKDAFTKKHMVYYAIAYCWFLMHY